MTKKPSVEIEKLPEYFKSHFIFNDISLLEWGINEIRGFISFIEPFTVNDERLYSDSFTNLEKTSFNYIHDKLNVFDFVNGEVKENTYEKRPKAAFWWDIYKLFSTVQHYRPFYDHHCSSKERKEQIMNLLNDTVLYLEQKKINKRI